MSDTCWYRLYNELNLTLEIINEDDLMVSTIEGPLPLNRYHSFVMDLASRFIGECRRNRDEAGAVPEEFTDLKDKLDHYFRSEFGTDYSIELSFPIEHLSGIRVERRYFGNDPEAIVLSARIEAFILAYDRLNEFLTTPPVIKRRRRNTDVDVRAFRIKSRDFDLREILSAGKNHGFISRSTYRVTFTDIFSGRPTEEKIDWTGTFYSLNRFIQGINGKYIDQLNHGKWEIVSRLFLVDGREASALSLRDAHVGGNDRLDSLNEFIDFFESFISEE